MPMKTKGEFKILRTINKIFKASEESQLSATFYKKVAKDLTLLENYFMLSEHQSIILVLVLALNYETNNAIGMVDLAQHLKISAIKLLEYKIHFNALVKSGVLIKTKGTHRRMRRTNFSNDEYIVNELITDSIVEESPMIKFEVETCQDILAFLEKIPALIHERNNGTLNTPEFILEFQELIHSHQHLQLLKKIALFELDPIEEILFLNLVLGNLNGNESLDLDRALGEIIDQPSMKVQCMQDFLASRTTLEQKALIELKKSEFFNNLEISLSEKATTLIKEEGIELFTLSQSKKGIIESTKIRLKKLYFEEETQAQIDLLSNSIKESNLRKIQSRLLERNLPVGINTLLYGFPGTGKTELVYQLARLTRREIIPVEVSNISSMWFGESEKLIKKVFTDYNEYIKSASRTPILLFNEADAILSTRKTNSHSNTSQTENAIQNIILEELERFEGLFFATTNLIGNLDDAFDRRFLYKIEFHKPDTQIKSKIWRSKIKGLKPSAYKALATSYDFTGGQIDNIVRKSEMTEIINGNKPDLPILLDFCNQELLNTTQKTSVGFRVGRS
jgi:SpoVK/Ycf46/Vps4 family AAA+-type ATPase